ncbi:hypothetical protein [Cellulomonas composti]|uniref:Uncharacterized protein n=1 Tax=Cellulomonas composti TaxID=266130 RepID=A0A511JBM1_9CELL|nr:hypothetical protein [Cellulomonas composti]GEL95382.1 hypothetical protein CCO02nite_20400 [Cellulomonas composti]
MRIRSTKPEFWRSARIASVSWDARLVLKGLESYVDDNGVGKDDLALIVGDVFPRDILASPRETYARVSEAVSDLHRAGLVWRYEVDGTRLMFVSFWEDIQRIDKPGKGRFRRPDGTLEYRDSIIRESVASPRESVAPGTGEQGNRGTGEQGKKDVSSEVADATVRRADVERILDHLDHRIAANGAKIPSRSKRNTDAARLLIDADGHTVAQIEAAIDFATSDEFWRSNVLSMSKLREKYDQLRLSAQRTRRPAEPRPTRFEENLAAVRAVAERDGLATTYPQIGAAL